MTHTVYKDPDGLFRLVTAPRPLPHEFPQDERIEIGARDSWSGYREVHRTCRLCNAVKVHILSGAMRPRIAWIWPGEKCVKEEEPMCGGGVG